VERAVERECGCIQVFTTSPKMWRHQVHEPGEVAGFRAGIRERGIFPAVAHAAYLINLASPNRALFAKSVKHLAQTGEWAGKLGLSAVVLHAGHAPAADMPAALSRVAQGLREAFRGWPEGVKLSLEMTAGGETGVGSSFGHFASIIDGLSGDKRVGVWLDTAHAFGAGYDLGTAAGVERLVAGAGGAGGWERVDGVHANDSKSPLGSHLDRHENIGEGLIGNAGFRLILEHPGLRALPFILETPGFDNRGPDLKGVRRLRELAGKGPA
jgi:deoxyribonuclease-4